MSEPGMTWELTAWADGFVTKAEDVKSDETEEKE